MYHMSYTTPLRQNKPVETLKNIFSPDNFCSPSTRGDGEVLTFYIACLDIQTKTLGGLKNPQS